MAAAKSSQPDFRSNFTPELIALLARAMLINRQFEPEFDVSITSLLIAFLFSGDSLCKQFQSYVQQSGINVPAILESRKLDQAAVEEILQQNIDPELLDREPRWTASIRTVFEHAEKYRYQVARGETSIPLDIRHVMAVYIYDPGGHDRDLLNWGFNREMWSNYFLSFIQTQYQDELDFWESQHRKTFDNAPTPVQSQPVAPPFSVENGPSTHIATDRWTLDDALGYRAYAYAIYRFMTHEQTHPPLTISVQAPWGGGKTSLMRMIQEYLDPEVFHISRDTGVTTTGALSIGKVLKEIDNWNSGKAQIAPPESEPQGDQTNHRMTIWFNAWKYASTDQVWAGLADTIIRQVSSRLAGIDRELFLLRLNLKRVNTDLIRNKIHEKIINNWRQRTIPWLWGTGLCLLIAVLTVIGGLLNQLRTVQNLGLGGVIISGLVSGVSALVNYLKARQDVTNEVAAISLNEYLDVPDYRSQLGFIHQVETDLRRVFDSVPQYCHPLVVFIDDLDRCSPKKVAEVVEGVNLFLGGDFPDCMFVIGMDAEMVAASLEAAHKDVIERLPVDAATPVGWRFMDKFVQLPFVIPPADPLDLKHYTKALLTEDKSLELDEQIESLSNSLLAQVQSLSDVDEETKRAQQAENLSNEQVESLRNQLEQRVIQRTLDSGIETFSDQDSGIREQIFLAAEAFSRNPRELKRFVNAFRYQYFLWWAQRAQGFGEEITLQQLQRWVVLSMKWPEVVRWIRRGGGREHRVTSDLPASRLQQLENLGEFGNERTQWFENAPKVVHMEPAETPWLRDDDLRQFFFDEYTKFPENERLSNGVGQGLW